MHFLYIWSVSFFLLGFGQILESYKKFSFEQQASWKDHYIQLQATKKFVGINRLDENAEVVSQKQIQLADGECFTIITERDRKNGFAKLLMKSNGEIVARLEYRFTVRGCCYIKGLYAFQKRQGYGALLLKTLLKELIKQGYQRAELHATEDAESFYKKYGFFYTSHLLSPDIYPQLAAMAKNL